MNTEQAQKYLTDSKASPEDMKQLPTIAQLLEVVDESIEEIWDAFKRNAKRRGITRQYFYNVLFDFYDWTLEAFITGNLARRDGTEWQTSYLSLIYFSETYGGTSPGYFGQSFMTAVEKQCGGYT